MRMRLTTTVGDNINKLVVLNLPTPRVRDAVTEVPKEVLKEIRTKCKKEQRVDHIREYI